MSFNSNFASSSHQRLTLTAAFVGMTVLISVLTYWGTTLLKGELSALDQQIAERQSLLLSAEQLSQDAQLLEQELSSAKQSLQQLQVMLPEIAEESQFLHQLSELAVDHQVALGDFRPGGTTQATHCKEIELKLRGTGQYSSLCRWLFSLQTLPRFIRISQISLLGSATPGGQCVLDVELKLLHGTNIDISNEAKT